MDVDRVELAVRTRVAARANRDESHDLAVHICDEGRRAMPVQLGALHHGKGCELVARERVSVRGLPGLDVHAGDRVGILRCSGADHPGEPTLLG
jgi:hypothetical protein